MLRSHAFRSRNSKFVARGGASATVGRGSHLGHRPQQVSPLPRSVSPAGVNVDVMTDVTCRQRRTVAATAGPGAPVWRLEVGGKVCSKCATDRDAAS